MTAIFNLSQQIVNIEDQACTSVHVLHDINFKYFGSLRMKFRYNDHKSPISNWQAVLQVSNPAFV